MSNIREVLIFILRVIIFLALIKAIDSFETIGTNITLLFITSIFGIWAGRKTSETNYSIKKVLTLNFFLIILTYILFWALNLLPLSVESYSHLKLAIFENHLTTILATFVICQVSSFFYYKFAVTTYIELLAGTIFFLNLLSAHRNYRFDLLNIVSELAWKLGLEQLTTIIIIAAVFFLIVFFYLLLSSATERFKGKSDKTVSSFSPIQISLSAIVLVGLYALLINNLYNYHYVEVLSKIRNGVNDEAKEGVSPLNFHSGLGGSSQATAVVRLEGDYTTNPYTPLIYFRETAVSKLAGKQLVIANSRFNPDVNLTHPESFFTQKQDFNLDFREPLNQSIFILTSHKIAFSVDYPISIVKLKNDKTRFKSVYRAYSMVPAFSPSEMENREFGNPNWSLDLKEHFLAKHPDTRYESLAKELTKDYDTKLEKARAILEYLTNKSIYTLQPGHESKIDDDPVAPYLFGDLRGYCVHFAHAITYMFRGLGIPSRVATGYMSDLSQSKDGHILLRMNDRHAWAEAYIDKLGWIVFDIQPKQVESHAETPVDAELLDELIGMLDPGEELLPQDLGRDEPGLSDENEFNIKTANLLKIILWIIVLVLILNFILINAYKLPLSADKKLKLLYSKLLVKLQSFNILRKEGESFANFKIRIKFNEKDIFKEIEILDKLYYSNYQLSDKESLGLLKDEKIEFKGFVSNLEEKKWLRVLKTILFYLNPVNGIKVVGRKV